MKRHRESRGIAFALALAAGSTVAAQSTPLIRLNYAQFDPLAGTPSLPPSLAALDPDEPGLYLVQFHATPTDLSRNHILSAGGRIGSFMTDHAYLVRMNATAAAVVAARPSVRWVGAFHAAYKLSPEARADALGLMQGPGDAPTRYSIHLFDRGPAAQHTVALTINTLGGIVDAFGSPGFRMEASLSPAQLRALAALPDIVWIERCTAPGADLILARTVSGATPYLSGLGFNGQGVRGQIADDGLLTTHNAFQATPPIFYGPVPPAEFHGTATFGICFSDGTGNANGTGVVSAAQGIFLAYSQLTDFGGPVSRYTAVADLVNPSLSWQGVFQASPWGGGLTTAYTSQSAEIDDIVFLHDLIIAQSQSNQASQFSRPQAWGKNVVSVGGVDLRGTVSLADDQADGASFGPAADGRIKPELTHSYNDATPPCSLSNSCYGGFGGTSASSAIIAGLFGLVHQMWHQGVWSGFGGGSSVFASRPRTATARALIISSAHQYDWTAGGPNGTITRPIQGWGLPNLQVMHERAAKTFIVNGAQPIEQAQTRSYQLLVPPGEPSLRAVLVYTDPAGNPAAAQARINDLHLRVKSPGNAETYWGNAGLNAGIWSSTGNAPDTINTVECVFIQNPAAGVWTVDIIGAELVQDALPATGPVDAEFSLVAVGATPYTPSPCYANCDGSTMAPLLTPNDFACFLAAYTNGESYANCDGSTVEPTLTPNDFACFLAAFNNGCS